MRIKQTGDSEFISVKIDRKQTAQGIFESLCVSSVNGIAFHVEPWRCLDISFLSFNGTVVSYLAPCGVQHPSVFDYSHDSFSDNMFFGLLSTCGLENTGPECVDEHGIRYSHHGSLNYCAANHAMVQFEENGQVLIISGCMQDDRFLKHHFILYRKIRFTCKTNEIAVEDTVVNNGEKDQICIMYHYNFGAPFLSDRCRLEIPYSSVMFKNDIAKQEFPHLMSISPPSSSQQPHVFYLDFVPAAVHSASVYNPELDMFAELSFGGDSLPYMDLWKNLHPDRYVMSFEPCNAFPYGRTHQVERGNACYLEKNEMKTYITTFKVGQKNGIQA